MSRASETFRPRPALVEATVIRDLVETVITRAGLDLCAAAQSRLDGVARTALLVALDRREAAWARGLADLRRHSLTDKGSTETDSDLARVAVDVRFGVARLLAAGITSSRGAWCDLAALAIVALAAAADGLLRRELVSVLRDLRAESFTPLSLDTLDVMAEVGPTAHPASLDSFGARLDALVQATITRLRAEIEGRATAAPSSRARVVGKPRRVVGAAAVPTVEALLTIDEACEYLGLSRSALYRRLADPACGLRALARPIPGSGHLRFSRSELDAWSARDRRRST